MREPGKEMEEQPPAQPEHPHLVFLGSQRCGVGTEKRRKETPELSPNKSEFQGSAENQTQKPLPASLLAPPGAAAAPGNPRELWGLL